jgi:hypothetical protein
VPILDVSERNLILDCRFGPSRSSLVTGSYAFELWSGDPRDVGSNEVSGGGYAAVADVLSNWGPADGGETTKTAAVDFVLTGALDDDDSVTHWLYRNTTTGLAAYCDALSEEILPTGAGTISILPTIPFVDPETDV